MKQQTRILNEHEFRNMYLRVRKKEIRKRKNLTTSSKGIEAS